MKNKITCLIEQLIETNQITFGEFEQWLNWGEHNSLYCDLKYKQLKEEYQDTDKKEDYIKRLKKEHLSLSARLHPNSLHSSNELNYLQLETLASFIQKYG